MNNDGSIYKENLSFKSIFYFCSLPIRLDSYKGCSFNCLYCFSQKLNNRKSDFFSSELKFGNVKKLESILALSMDESDKSGVLRSSLSRRLPIHLGSVSDPFQNAESRDKITYEYLRILLKFNYPTIISTKGTLVSEQEYLELLKNFPTVVQTSFSTLSTNLASKIEPHAPTPSERLRSLEKLAKAGIWTSVRLQPFLFPVTTPDQINFKSFADVGVKHVVLEHLRIPTNSSLVARTRLFNALGVDIIAEYKKMGMQISRINFELSSELKLMNILEIRSLVHKQGMSFGSADNDFHHVSDMPCCCGLPKDVEFQNYYKGQIGYSLYEAMKSGEVCLDNIDNEWQPSGSIVEFLNSDCRKNGKKTTKEFLMDKVNNPLSSNSPLSFAGIAYDKKKGYSIDEEFRRKFLKQE